MQVGVVKQSTIQQRRFDGDDATLPTRRTLKSDLKKQSDDAAEVELTQKLREAKGLAGLDLMLPEKEEKSFAVESLKSLRGIVKKLKDLANVLKDGGLSREQRQATIKEGDSLAQDYQRIVSSSEFTKLREVSSQVTQIAASKVSSNQSLDPLLKHLNAEHQGLLGAEFIQLVEHGDMQKLDSVVKTFDSLAANGLPSFGTEFDADAVMEKLDQTLSSIDGALKTLGKLPTAQEIFSAKQEQNELELDADLTPDENAVGNLEHALLTAAKLQEKILLQSLQALNGQSNGNAFKAFTLLDS